MANKKGNSKSKINLQREIETKKRKRRKIIIITILIILLITGICIYVSKSEAFNITEIKITGNNQLTEEQICQIAEIKKGDNIFLKPGIVLKVKLKEKGYIEEAEIKKKYPNKIAIKITERQKGYQIITEDGGYIYIDEQGYVLEYSTNKLDLKTITGMNITKEEVEKQKRLIEEDIEKMENILHIEDEANKIGIGDKIQQIDTKDEYIIHLNEDEIIINLGNATNLNDRMYYVNAILKQESGNSGTIYVNGNINEGFAPYFREK